MYTEVLRATELMFSLSLATLFALRLGHAFTSTKIADPAERAGPPMSHNLDLCPTTRIFNGIERYPPS
jgi:hypothetical protein